MFLIHKTTGLLLSSVSGENQATADDDMVSAMLIAIRQYIKDSLKIKSEHSVEGIRAGDYMILAEEGPRAILAAITRGNPPPTFRETMQKTLETVHIKLARQLKLFNGDTASFEKNTALLKPCLITKTKGSAGKKPVYALVLILILAGVAGFFTVRHSVRVVTENRFIKALDAEPGIIVLSSSRGVNSTRLAVLRDQKAAPVKDILAAHNLRGSQFEISEEPFYSPYFSSQPSKRGVPEHLLEIARRLSTYTFYFARTLKMCLKGRNRQSGKQGGLCGCLWRKQKRRLRCDS